MKVFILISIYTFLDNKIISYNYVTRYSCGKSNVKAFLDYSESSTYSSASKYLKSDETIFFSVETSGCEIDFLSQVSIIVILFKI